MRAVRSLLAVELFPAQESRVGAEDLLNLGREAEMEF